jgi:arrestin (S-antigen)-like protein
MSKCELTIVIDGDRTEFQIGETVTGYLQVRVDSNCRCDGLTLTQEWSTHGKGNRASGGEQVLRLYRGEWKAGENHSYPFEFTIPEGPVTYHGHYLNVDHYLRAVADIPWAFDPKAERELLVVPAEAKSKEDVARVLDAAPEAEPATKVPLAFIVFFGAMFMLPGLGFAIGGGLQVADGQMDGAIMAVFGTIFFIAGAAVAFFGIRNSLAERKLGPVIASATPKVALPGEEISLVMDFNPRSEARLNEITATLKGVESVTSGSGTNTTTYTHTLHEEKVVLRGNGRLFAREAQELAAKVTLPADAAPSFSATDNSLTWKVEFHIDIAQWPDWTSTAQIQVAAL